LAPSYNHDAISDYTWVHSHQICPVTRQLVSRSFITIAARTLWTYIREIAKGAVTRTFEQNSSDIIELAFYPLSSALAFHKSFKQSFSEYAHKTQQTKWQQRKAVVCVEQCAMKPGKQSAVETQINAILFQSILQPASMCTFIISNSSYRGEPIDRVTCASINMYGSELY
jgi:hypothetical protein